MKVLLIGVASAFAAFALVWIVITLFFPDVYYEATLPFLLGGFAIGGLAGLVIGYNRLLRREDRRSKQS